MRICYALRRGVFYPSQRDAFGEIPPKEHRAQYLRRVARMGVDGIEIPAFPPLGVTTAEDARDFRKELEDAGVPAVCVRGGGALADPRVGPEVMERNRRAVQFASWVGAEVVNLTCVAVPTHPGGPGERHVGERVSQGASRLATETDFERHAARFRDIGQMAADLGLDVSLEVHQGSIVDCSWAAMKLVELIDLPNVGPNPDLGNIYWQYEFPEETMEAAIVAMAPKAKYWHCKNMIRVNVPEANRSIFLRVPLPDGQIDYRFAIAAMVRANYQGFLAVEGVEAGDQITRDESSVQYVKRLLSEIDQPIE